MRVRLSIPEVKARPEDRPCCCPRCGGQVLHQAQVHPRRRFIDTKLSAVATIRYACNACGKTFHHYPQGVTRKQQSARVVVLASLLYGLGLSTDATAKVLHLLGAGVSKATVWRDAQEMGQGLRRKVPQWGKVRVLAADETVFKVKGKEVVVGFVTDAATGQVVGVDVLVDRTAKGFARWLRKYARRLGTKVVVTDDLATYRPALEELGLAHKVCLAHVRRNATRRLREIEGHEEAKERLKQILKELPLDGARQLLDLALQVREQSKLYLLALRLSERWDELSLHQRVVGVPATNNVSERAIGPSKIRYATMRGFKSVDGMMNLIALSRELYGGVEQTRLVEALAA